jgi:predicted nucleic acid-binding protein
MSAPDAVISNSSPLIALERIGHLAILHRLFDERLVIPLAVAREVYGESSPPSWIRVVPIAAAADAGTSPTLGAGEREAIALALEQRASLIILDDLPARRVAASRGLAVIGTVGVLLAAKQTGAIAAVRPLLDALVAAGFRLSTRVYDAALGAAGET